MVSTPAGSRPTLLPQTLSRESALWSRPTTSSLASLHSAWQDQGVTLSLAAAILELVSDSGLRSLEQIVRDDV